MEVVLKVLKLQSPTAHEILRTFKTSLVPGLVHFADPQSMDYPNGLP